MPGWELSNHMDSGLSLAALEKALRRTGRVPGILNTGQGSQFTPDP